LPALLQSHIAQQAILGNKIESFFIQVADKILEGFEVKFSAEDWPGWAASFFTWVASIVPAKQPPPSPQAAPIDNAFTIGIFGRLWHWTLRRARLPAEYTEQRRRVCAIDGRLVGPESKEPLLHLIRRRRVIDIAHMEHQAADLLIGRRFADLPHISDTRRRRGCLRCGK
jgi:hypothetical protein